MSIEYGWIGSLEKHQQWKEWKEKQKKDKNWRPKGYYKGLYRHYNYDLINIKDSLEEFNKDPIQSTMDMMLGYMGECEGVNRVIYIEEPLEMAIKEGMSLIAIRDNKVIFADNDFEWMILKRLLICHVMSAKSKQRNSVRLLKI